MCQRGFGIISRFVQYVFDVVIQRRFSTRLLDWKLLKKSTDKSQKMSTDVLVRERISLNAFPSRADDEVSEASFFSPKLVG